MTRSEKRELVAIHSAIDAATGDTDPGCGDMTDEEMRRDEPLLWAAMHLAKMIDRSNAASKHSAAWGDGE